MIQATKQRLSRSHAALCCALAVFSALAVRPGHAQPKPPLPGNYPAKSIRVLLGSGAGGGGDSVARAMAPALSERWGRPVVVDNRIGAGGIIALEMLAQAYPDGYTLYVGGTQVVTATVLKKVPFDVRKVYTPVVQLTSQPYVLLVTPALPLNSVKDLIALAKSKPGVLNYGSTGVGASSHLGTEVFNYMTGAKMQHVPYKGTGQVMVDIISGQIQVLFISTISGMPQVKSGRLKAIAVTSAKRLSQYPDLPTVAESGVPGFELNDGYGLYAPAGLPASILLALNREVSAIMNAPELRERLAASGAEPAAPNSPAEFKATFAGRIAKLEQFFKASGLTPETLR
jgi:tripartite-type tricarboxylate transporter receptor subunit TctC